VLIRRIAPLRPSCLFTTSPEQEGGGATLAMLQGGPDPRIATRQASSSPRLLKERAWGPEWAEGKIDGGLDKWRRPIK
jgi:hypothetical protein